MQYDDIQRQFNKVIAYSQNISNPNTDKLFADWLEAKRDFIEVMNGKLIWEWPEKVYFELGTKEKSLRIDDFVDTVCGRYQNEELADFIAAQRKGFFSNQVVVPEIAPNGEKIPAGMRLVKAFKFFEPDEYALHEIQSAASMIMQEDKIEGTLCMSVHPLDFLSASENTHNWRSCHALDGEYRAGNLSYMVDRSTIMCYLKSNKEEKLPDFPNDVPWNSKKWRVFLYFADQWDMIFAGRQYPFTSETGLNFVRERVLPALNMGTFSPWLVKKVKAVEEQGYYWGFRKTYMPMGNELVPITDVVKNNPGSLQFNDILSSSCYDPLYAVKIDENRFWGPAPVHGPHTRFHIGGAVKCCRCGEDQIELSETFMCNDCELEYGESENDMFATCPCCGHRYLYDEGLWIESAEECVCPNCADEYVTICENCGEAVYSTDAVYDRKTESWVCRWCYDDRSR